MCDEMESAIEQADVRRVRTMMRFGVRYRLSEIFL